MVRWGYDEGSSSDKEWSNYLDMINRTISRTGFPRRPRNITVKITSSGGFN